MVDRTLCFDLDNTLCVTSGLNYESSKPIVDRIQIVNLLYEAGCTIKIYTARGSETGVDWRELTLTQLKNWGVKFHSFHIGKPAADLYIDDKGIGLNFFELSKLEVVNLLIKK